MGRGNSHSNIGSLNISLISFMAAIARTFLLFIDFLQIIYILYVIMYYRIDKEIVKKKKNNIQKTEKKKVRS
jgi:hypothetical protein